MIERSGGALRLSDAVVAPYAAERDLEAAGWTRTATGWLREGEDPRGRALVVAARVVSGRARGLELRYSVRRPAIDVNGDEDWEAGRKDFHDAIAREWFASSVHDLLYAPPPQPGPLTFHFDWGVVRSDIGARGAVIDVRWAETD